MIAVCLRRHQVRVCLTRGVQSWTSVDIWVDVAQVVRGDIDVLRCDSKEHCAVDGWVSGKGACVGLDGDSSVARNVLKRDIGGIQLVDEHGESWSISDRRSCGDV